MKRIFLSVVIASCFCTTVFAGELPEVGSIPPRKPITVPTFSSTSKSPLGKASVKAKAKLEAIKHKRVQAQEPQILPGIGKMPGVEDPLGSHPVRVSPDRTTLVNVSVSLPNRISTPFSNPKSIDNQASDFDVQSVGQSLYVTMKNQKPVVLFVTGDKPNDPVVSLTLVPKRMPSQTILLQLDKGAVNGGGSSASNDDPPDSNSYSDKIRYVMRSVAQHKEPEGFSEADLPSGIAKAGPLLIYPKKRYSGPTFDIYRYNVESTKDQIEMQESSFFSKGVRAIAFFPKATLNQGDTTEVYILSDKPEDGEDE